MLIQNHFRIRVAGMELALELVLVDTHLQSISVFCCCQTRAKTYSRLSLVPKRPNTRRVHWCDLLAGLTTPTLFPFLTLTSATRVFVSSHEPQNPLLPCRHLRVSDQLNEQHAGPGVHNLFGDSHANKILSK